MKGKFIFLIPQKPSGESPFVKISQTPFAKLPLTQKGQSATDLFGMIVQNHSAQLAISITPSRKLPLIRGSHYALFDWVREQEAGV